jgi:hypothetical protein
LTFIDQNPKKIVENNDVSLNSKKMQDFVILNSITCKVGMEHVNLVQQLPVKFTYIFPLCVEILESTHPTTRV